MRTLVLSGVCGCCGDAGPVWHTTVTPPIDYGHILLKCRTDLPDLCERCQEAQARYEDWVYRCYVPYPHAEPPPRTPPVRIPTDDDGGPV